MNEPTRWDISLVFAFSVLCFSNLSVVIPPSGFIDIVMERSNRTRGAFVSPNHSGLCWKQRDRGGGGGEQGGGGGRDRGRSAQREGETTKAPVWFSGTEEGRKEIQRRRRRRRKRENTRRLIQDVLPIVLTSDVAAWRQTEHAAAIFVFLSLPACVSETPMRGPVDTKRLPHHMPVCFPLNLLHFFMPWIVHMDCMGTIWGKADKWVEMIGHCCFRKRRQPSRDTWQI